MIIVCSLADQKSICQSVDPSHLISVVDPGYQPETPQNIHNHLKLGFDDIIEIRDENLIYRVPGVSSKQVLHVVESIYKKGNVWLLLEVR